MTAPFICVLLAFALTFLTKAPLAMAQLQQPGGYNNHNPRDQQAGLSGWGRRALAAHANSHEAFPAFAAAVIIAHLCEADATWASWLSIIFVAARLIYVLLYLADLATLRSLVWTIGTVCICLLFVLPWI